MDSVIGNTVDEIDAATLLSMARELDRFSRRFERFFVLQLKQLGAAVDKFQREREHWERQRTRAFQQIEENRRALQDAWQQIQQGITLLT